MKACVIFDSRYGNTERLARAFAAGLAQSGLEVLCSSSKDATPESMEGSELVCLGAPTEWHSASKAMKEFLRRIEHVDMSAKYAFAFDTKLASPLSGSASKLIEKRLKKLGATMVAHRESAVVSSQKGVKQVSLPAGEEGRFHDMGVRIGGAVLSKQRKASTAVA